MKKILFMLIIAITCNISAWSQTAYSAVEIGKEVMQSKNFALAKTLLTNNGFICNKNQTTTDCIVYENPYAKYVDQAIVIRVHKEAKTNKASKYVILLGGQSQINRYIRALKDLGFKLDVWSREYECGNLVVKESRNNRGWFEAAFYNRK